MFAKILKAVAVAIPYAIKYGPRLKPMIKELYAIYKDGFQPEDVPRTIAAIKKFFD